NFQCQTTSQCCPGSQRHRLASALGVEIEEIARFNELCELCAYIGLRTAGKKWRQKKFPLYPQMVEESLFMARSEAPWFCHAKFRHPFGYCSADYSSLCRKLVLSWIRLHSMEDLMKVH